MSPEQEQHELELQRRKEEEAEREALARDVLASLAAPFIVQEQAGIAGTYWCAVDPRSGIVIGGEPDRNRACRFAEALNAAYQRGREDLMVDRAIWKTNEEIAKARNP